MGIDFKTFSQLVYQNTNASLQFLTATDTNRKKFLIDLLHLDAYVNLFEVFKEASKESSNTLIALSSEIATVDKWLSNNKLESTNILPLLDLEINTEEDEKSFRSLSVELNNISEKNKKILQNNKYKELLSHIDIEKIQNSNLPEKESYDSYQKELGEIVGKINTATKMLLKLEKLEDICPTCEQKVDSEFKQDLINTEKDNLSHYDYRKDINEDMIRQIKRNNAARDGLNRAQKEWEDLYRSIDNSLPNQILNQVQLQEELDSVSTRLSEAKKELKKIAEENERITRANTRIEIIQAQTDGFIEKLNSAQEVLDTQRSLDSNLEILKKAFSTNGLLAYKIENLVKELEELANTYLAELSDGRFTLEFVVSNDKLNVQITDNENIVDILALSSGELARVNTATLIAIRKLMSSISKSRINILFLDEVINVLDDSGREKLVEVLLEEDLNTYVVSHGWTHPLLEKIEVVKRGNVSGLEQ